MALPTDEFLERLPDQAACEITTLPNPPPSA
jgi:hypothetical protein